MSCSIAMEEERPVHRRVANTGKLSLMYAGWQSRVFSGNCGGGVLVASEISRVKANPCCGTSYCEEGVCRIFPITYLIFPDGDSRTNRGLGTILRRLSAPVACADDGRRR